MGDLSLNFSKWEFKCDHCGRLVGPELALIDVLQRLRTGLGEPLRVVSGYRCVTHNRAVGGVKRSHHLTGAAADIPRGLVRPSEARAAGAKGVGVRDGWVIHVDAGPWRQVTFVE